MKTIYFFGGGKADGNGKQKELLGGKGAGLAEMVNLGIPVPPGFTITTEVCTYYYQHDQKLPDGIEDEVRKTMARVGELMGAVFGDAKNPLLVSVRSGARVSMPGMMDTVLNLGLNDVTVQGLIERTKNPRFAYDAYRRFVSMYGDVVMGLKPESEKEHDPFEVILEAKKKERGVEKDIDLTADDLKDLVARYKAEIKKRKGVAFPEDPWQQLWGAIGAVFQSWENPRAKTYRKMYGYSADWGTAVNVQSMVFGNMGDDCATGVAFTRDPGTGEKIFFGEFLVNAQGEDVVAGIRTPRPIPELGTVLEPAYKQLLEIRERLEQHFRDMQDIEFTIQNGKLWMLQTRNGKRAARAMVKIAVDLVKEKLINEQDAVLRLEPGKFDELLHPMIDPKAKRKVIAKGLPASPGAAIGKVTFSATEAEQLAEKGEKVILVRHETSPEDVHGMKAAQGILTSRGGMTSHAAVVARGMGKCCVAGAASVYVDYAKGEFRVGDVAVKEGEVITLDGTAGEVILGTMPLVPAKMENEVAEIMAWVDKARRLKVRTNADTPKDAEVARAFGAEGIGLCRTEHMFFEPDRILAVRQMILSGDEKSRRAALAKLLPMQRGDFVGIFNAMNGLPVTVRLLDPPLHEFLPQTEADIAEVAKALGVQVDKVKAKNKELHEANPMLGHRGCRLAVTFPEIYEMQVQAICEAAAQVKKAGVDVRPEIMIPIVGMTAEIDHMRELTVRIADETFKKAGVEVPYMVGTMIELPRACVVADEIAKHAEFFSFGTNDLTQTTFGFSRDDIGSFLPSYIEKRVLEKDPFMALDRNGVGELMKMAVAKGRSVREKLKIGICGEHGGEPSSVEFCHMIGLDYVSCSPYRVPIARVAAAQAAIKGAKA